MNNYMFTETRKFQLIKPSWLWFTVSLIVSVLAHLGFNSPIIKVTSNALSLAQSNLAISAGLHAGFVTILFSIVASNYGWTKQSDELMNFARTTLSIWFGALLGWALISFYQAENLTLSAAGVLSYIYLLGKFWLIPNLYKHIHDYSREFHTTLNTATLLIAITALILSLRDILNVYFPGYM